MIILAVGVWIGQKIYCTVAENQATEREVKLRKRLQQFLRENMPSLELDQVKQEVEALLK